MIQLAAMILMVIDHIGFLFFPDMLIFRAVGRLCFPLYAYLLAMGFQHSRSIFIYAFRLLLLASLSQWVYFDLLGFRLNVIFLMCLGVLFLWCLQNRRLLLACVIFAMVAVLPIEYGLYGLCLIVIFATAKNAFWLVWLSFMVCALSVLFYGPFQFIAFFAVLFILYLPENSLRINRYLWRYFYPAHLYLLKGVLCVFA
jgi:hypothetical protein